MCLRIRCLEDGIPGKKNKKTKKQMKIKKKIQTIVELNETN